MFPFGAREGTRTLTSFRTHGPEPCLSANSSTLAYLSQAPEEREINWCGWRDLNPHERSSPPPQDGASADSATSAYGISAHSEPLKTLCYKRFLMPFVLATSLLYGLGPRMSTLFFSFFKLFKPKHRGITSRKAGGIGLPAPIPAPHRPLFQERGSL